MSHICHFCLVAVSAHSLAFIVEGKEVNVCDECHGKTSGLSVRVFHVPSYNLSVLGTKFAKLSRRAKKCDLPSPTFQEIGTSRLVRKVRDEQTGEIRDHVTLLSHITVDVGCTVVKVEGWTFIATVQHTEEGNILRKIGDVVIPVKYRTVSQLCEHCETSRNRKDTYILHHEATNTYKQVGRNCLADFFGHDALMYAERAQLLCDINSIGESMEDEEGFGGGGGSDRFDALETYCAHVAQVITLDGWMSRKRARDIGCDGSATCDVANIHLHRRLAPPKYVFMYATPSPESVLLAEQAIEWVSNLEGEELSDYLHNIRTIGRRGVCEGRDRGMAASIVSAYQRHLSTLRYKELQARRAEVSQHVGVVGERGVFKLNVEKVLQFERDGYGYNSGSVAVHLHIMSDNDGNVVTWWSSSGALPTGSDVVLKGTVKKHDVRNGVKQTTLTRCEEVEYKTYIVVLEGVRHTFEALSEIEVKKALRAKLGIARLPKGTHIVVDSGEKTEGVDKEETFSIAV